MTTRYIHSGSIYKYNGQLVRVIRTGLSNGTVCVTSSKNNSAGLYGFVKPEKLEPVGLYSVARFLGRGRVASAVLATVGVGE